MRILILGAGGVGSAAARIAVRRPFLDRVVVADFDLGRAEAAVAHVADDRFAAERLDASDQTAIEALIRAERIDAVLGATDPRFTMPIFRAALATGIHYLDMAMSLSRPHPTEPYTHPGVKLGDEQFAMSDEWAASGRVALVGIGVEPGLSDVFARYAADHLFTEIDELGVRDGANLSVAGFDFAPSFSIWTTIEECLNPPLVYEKERGWFTTAPFSEPEIFDFPDGIGPVECVNVEHEEVVLMPRWIDAKRVTFKYGLGDEFIDVLKTLHKLGLDRTDKVRVGGVGGQPARRRGCLPAGSGDARGPDDRQDLCRGLGEGDGQGRRRAIDLPVPRRRQRLVDARVRNASRRLADRRQSDRRARAAVERAVDGSRGARTGGVRRCAVPHSARRRVRLSLGSAGACRPPDGSLVSRGGPTGI